MQTLLKWLDAEDFDSRKDRLSRLDWLASHTPKSEYWTFPGGFLAKSHFEEMRYCYVYGQFLAATILGVAYIEITLAALFYGAGCDNLERAGSARLLEEGGKYGLITNREYKHLNDIRKRRNAYAHFRKPGHKEGVERRMISDDKDLYVIIEEDATIVVETALRIVVKNVI